MTRRPSLRSRSPRTRRRGSRGVALVEAALAFPLIVALTFGGIELGLIFTSKSTTTASTQSGVRLATVVLGTASDPAAAIDLVRDDVVGRLDALTGLGTPETLWIYRADTDGSPVGSPGFSGCATDCRIYTWDGSDFAYDSGTWAAPDACLFDSDGVDTVGVYLEVEHTPVTGFLFSSLSIDEHTVATLEPLPLDGC